MCMSCSGTILWFLCNIGVVRAPNPPPTYREGWIWRDGIFTSIGAVEEEGTYHIMNASRDLSEEWWGSVIYPG
jgi:hypothetical protein